MCCCVFLCTITCVRVAKCPYVDSHIVIFMVSVGLIHYLRNLTARKMGFVVHEWEEYSPLAYDF